MISLILTILYLAKDTVHRWFTRVSSPIARILVVYFLTLCALGALGGYVISLNVVRDKIIKRGGNMVVSRLVGGYGSVPTQKEMSELMDADSIVFQSLGYVRLENGRNILAYTYPFNRSRQVLPLLAPSGGPTILQNPEESHMPPGPCTVEAKGVRFQALVKNIPEDHLLYRSLPNWMILLVPPDHIPSYLTSTGMSHTTVLIRVRHLVSSESVLRVERMMRNLLRYEHLVGNVASVSDVLRQMDVVLAKQMQCRIAFCLGISVVVGILLTALAGMEYRQNEYIYTLMKSFGIHPLLLVGAFIVENILLVGLSFAGAIATFMYFQRVIVVEILKLGNYTLSLEQISSEIAIISYTLLGCILVSSIPIITAAYRQIGRVLK